MDKLDNLCAQARAAVPGAAGLDCFVRLQQDGVHPALYSYHACATGPGVVGKVKAEGISAEETAQALRKAWATARRAYEVAQVLSECRRLSDGNLDNDQAELIEKELLHCHWSLFEAKAGRARKSAQSLSPTYSQAA